MRALLGFCTLGCRKTQRETILSNLGWSESSQDAADDEAGQVTIFAEPQDQQEPRPHLETRKGEALARIWHRFNTPDPSDEQQPESSASTVRQPSVDHVGGVRLLIKEMQNDPELADALRAHLAASLRRIAKDYVERPLNRPALEDPQQPLFRADHYEEAPSRTSSSRQVRQAVLSLQAKQTDLVSSLQEIENIIRSLQLSQLKITVVLDVTSPDTPAMNSAIIRSSVEVVDSLERLRKTARKVSKSAQLLREDTSEFSGRVEVSNEFSRYTKELREATRQLLQSTEKLGDEVQRMVEDRLASDREESKRGNFLRLGEMLYFGPRLQHSDFDPSLQTAFGSAGDLLTSSLLSVWQWSEKPQDVASSA